MFYSTTGIQFQMEEDQVTIGSVGFDYIKLKSTTQGEKSNIEALQLNRIVPTPSGHQYVVNEYMATGGRDVESDEQYRRRIKENPNKLSRGTIAMLEQVFVNINNNILRVIRLGNSKEGFIRLGIVTVNGSQLSQAELDQLMNQGHLYFNLNEYQPIGNNSYKGIQLENIELTPIDISFRVQLDDNADPDAVRKQTQVAISKYLDWRNWDSSRKNVEWDDLLTICKNIKGVRMVPDQYFYPRIDMKIDNYNLPILRGFLMLDLSGNIIADARGNLTPVHYPNTIDQNYYTTVIRNL